MTNTRQGVITRDFGDEPEYGRMMADYRRHLRARGLSDGTVAQRLLHIEHLHAHYRDLLSVTTENLESLLSARRHTHAAESRRSMRSSWQRFYAWANKTGRLDTDPAAQLAPIRLPRVVARIADDNKVIAALSKATARDATMILLGRLAGLRLSEITTLRTEHREGTVLRVKGKGEHTRMVPIHPDLLEALTRLERIVGAGYYFPGRFGGHMHPTAVGKIIYRTTGCNPHSLRHAAATAAYGSTKDLRGLQEWLGHKNLSATERYVHVRPEQIRAISAATSIGARAHEGDEVW